MKRFKSFLITLGSALLLAAVGYFATPDGIAALDALKALLAEHGIATFVTTALFAIVGEAIRGLINQYKLSRAEDEAGRIGASRSVARGQVDLY